jgi:hypothetical protein
MRGMDSLHSTLDGRSRDTSAAQQSTHRIATQHRNHSPVPCPVPHSIPLPHYTSAKPSPCSLIGGQTRSHCTHPDSHAGEPRAFAACIHALVCLVPPPSPRPPSRGLLLHLSPSIPCACQPPRVSAPRAAHVQHTCCIMAASRRRASSSSSSAAPRSATTPDRHTRHPPTLHVTTQMSTSIAPSSVRVVYGYRRRLRRRLRRCLRQAPHRPAGWYTTGATSARPAHATARRLRVRAITVCTRMLSPPTD